MISSFGLRTLIQTLAIVVLVMACLLSANLTAEAQRNDLRIEIRKADRELRLFEGDELVATYPVGLGFEPVADKHREGDGATPEGTFRVCVKNPQSRFYLSLGITYPTTEDAERGLGGGLVTEEQAEAIRRAERRGVCPPWDTPLGGEIYIHGNGAGSDWTLGCLALDDADMKVLFDTVPVGTEVVVLP